MVDVDYTDYYCVVTYEPRDTFVKDPMAMYRIAVYDVTKLSKPEVMRDVYKTFIGEILRQKRRMSQNVLPHDLASVLWALRIDPYRDTNLICTSSYDDRLNIVIDAIRDFDAKRACVSPEEDVYVSLLHDSQITEKMWDYYMYHEDPYFDETPYERDEYALELKQSIDTLKPDDDEEDLL